MKIYRSVEINMLTGEIIAEDSYDYEGEVALCKGGGGGGGQSGKVSYPTYMSQVHCRWLTGSTDFKHDGGEEVGGIVGLIQAAMSDANNPYAGEDLLYDPTDDLYAVESRIESFLNKVEALNEVAMWNNAFLSVKNSLDSLNFFRTKDKNPLKIDPNSSTVDVIDDAFMQSTSNTQNLNIFKPLVEESNIEDSTEIDADTLWNESYATVKEKVDESGYLTDAELADELAKFDALQRAQLDNALAQFDAGMADIGAVQTSAFVLGKKHIYDQATRPLAEFNSSLLLQNRKEKLDFLQRLTGQLLTEKYKAISLMLEDKKVRRQRILEEKQMKLNTLLQTVDKIMQVRFKDTDIGIDEAKLQIATISDSIGKLLDTADKNYNLGKSANALYSAVIESKDKTADNYYSKVIDNNALKKHWPFKLMTGGGNMLASIGGASLQNWEKSSGKQSGGLSSLISGGMGLASLALLLIP